MKWEYFTGMFTPDRILRKERKYENGYVHSTIWLLSNNRVEVKPDYIQFWDGCRVGKFLKEDNEVVSSENGIYTVFDRSYHTIETEEMEEVWLNDGGSEMRPVEKTLETYDLVPYTFSFYRRIS